jgi:alpha-tubulin suppressor-like RCC1 family protein
MNARPWRFGFGTSGAMLAAGLACAACTDGPLVPGMRLVFVVQPSRVPWNAVLTPGPQVAIVNDAGEVNTGVAVPVRLTLREGPASTTLSGVTIVNTIGGVATFPDLRVDQMGAFSLVASAPGFSAVMSASFRVFTPFMQVASGGEHTCATAPTGVAYCWGHNISGQLGSGTRDNSPVPQQVTLPAGVPFATISAGFQHTCGLANGVVYCWGSGLAVRRDETISDLLLPTLFTIPGGAPVSTVSAGTHHTCGLTSFGDAYCWGSNNYGGLGDGTLTERITPTPVTGPPDRRYSAIDAGFENTCAIGTEGATYCWGNNDYGALGDGTQTHRTTPTLVLLPAAVRLTGITVGGSHSCGITAMGAAYCWGRNDAGQLGDGTTTSRPTPALVPAPGGATFASISAGAFSTCALTTAGSAYCWGHTPAVLWGVSPTLMELPAAVRLAALNVGAHHACGVTADGTAYCWGDNSWGQAGNGTVTSTTTPRPVLQL